MDEELPASLICFRQTESKSWDGFKCVHIKRSDVQWLLSIEDGENFENSAQNRIFEEIRTLLLDRIEERLSLGHMQRIRDTEEFKENDA